MSAVTDPTDSAQVKYAAHDRRRYFEERTRLAFQDVEEMEMNAAQGRVEQATEAAKRPYTRAYFRIDRRVHYGGGTHPRWEECTRYEATDPQHERDARKALEESRRLEPLVRYRLVGVVENVLDDGGE